VSVHTEHIKKKKIMERKVNTSVLFANLITQLITEEKKLTMKRILVLSKLMYDSGSSLIVLKLFQKWLSNNSSELSEPADNLSDLDEEYVLLLLDELVCLEGKSAVDFPSDDIQIFVKIYINLAKYHPVLYFPKLNNSSFANRMVRYSLTIPMFESVFEGVFRSFGHYLCPTELLDLREECNGALSSSSSKTGFIECNKDPFNKFVREFLKEKIAYLIQSIIRFLDGKYFHKIKAESLKALIENIDFDLFRGFQNFDMIDQIAKLLGFLSAMYPEHKGMFERRAMDFKTELPDFSNLPRSTVSIHDLMDIYHSTENDDMKIGEQIMEKSKGFDILVWMQVYQF